MNTLSELFDLIEPCERSKQEITEYVEQYGMESFIKNYNEVYLTASEKSKIMALSNIIDSVEDGYDE